MKKDIVYILKENINSEELRYSLRSVCKNFDFNKIWFYCGCPVGIKPDHHIPFVQKGYNKLDRVHNTMQAIFENDDITPDFYLFNDDFFVMQPYEQDISFSNGSLLYVADSIRKRNGIESFYIQYLKYTAQILREKGYDTLSYACHVPLLINRKKGLETLHAFPSDTLFRSVYGNHHQIGGQLIEDVKIVTLDTKPNENCILLSTNEYSFEYGVVGEFIRKKFSIPCKYETDLNTIKIYNPVVKEEKHEQVIEEPKSTELIELVESIESIDSIKTTETTEITETIEPIEFIENIDLLQLDESIEEPEQFESAEIIEEKHKTWWQKFVEWFLGEY